MVGAKEAAAIVQAPHEQGDFTGSTRNHNSLKAHNTATTTARRKTRKKEKNKKKKQKEKEKKGRKRSRGRSAGDTGKNSRCKHSETLVAENVLVCLQAGQIIKPE